MVKQFYKHIQIVVNHQVSQIVEGRKIIRSIPLNHVERKKSENSLKQKTNESYYINNQTNEPGIIVFLETQNYKVLSLEYQN